jgi:two-component system phosphate regulon response regulator PhoB
MQKKEASSDSLLQVADMVLDEELHRVSIGTQPLDLTATEFKLLKLLMERKGRVQTRENLLVNVWNYDTDTETRTIDTHIRRLREKLGERADLIETVRGVGYRINEPG